MHHGGACAGTSQRTASSCSDCCSAVALFECSSCAQIRLTVQSARRPHFSSRIFLLSPTASARAQICMRMRLPFVAPAPHPLFFLSSVSSAEPSSINRQREGCDGSNHFPASSAPTLARGPLLSFRLNLFLRLIVDQSSDNQISHQFCLLGPLQPPLRIAPLCLSRISNDRVVMVEAQSRSPSAASANISCHRLALLDDRCPKVSGSCCSTELRFLWRAPVCTSGRGQQDEKGKDEKNTNRNRREGKRKRRDRRQ
jgi:hypothetical protein